MVSEKSKSSSSSGREPTKRSSSRRKADPPEEAASKPPAKTAKIAEKPAAKVEEKKPASKAPPAKAAAPKAATPSPSKAAPAQSTVKKDRDGDVYKIVTDYEEAMSMKSTPDADHGKFKATCNKIKELMMEINELKKSDTPEAKEEIGRKKVAVCLQFVALKKINRSEKYKTKNSREMLSKARQQVDSYHLQLQNLLYESLHLHKAVTKCLEFKSEDKDIDLVPVDEFYKSAPASISREEETKADTHLQRLARLEWELEQRKILAAKCDDMVKLKDEVASDITKKNEHLDNINPQLQGLMKAMVPVQEQLGMTSSKNRKLHKMAVLLPEPLYAVFVQLEAYMDASDKLISVSIAGDEEEARSFKNALAQDDDNDDTDSELEDLIQPRRSSRRVSRVDRQEEERRALLQKHPLSVELVVKLKKFNDSITLRFSYLPKLQVVTVQNSVHVDQVLESKYAGDLISPNTLLSELYPKDNGLISPNTSNHFQLKELGMEDFSQYVNEIGFPYKWAQQMCGFSFLSESQNEGHHKMITKVDPSVSRGCVPEMVATVRNRFKARMALGRQIQDFEKCKVVVLPSQAKLFPAKVTCNLATWEAITWEDFETVPANQHLIEEGVIASTDTFYKANFTRLNSDGHFAKLTAYIDVKADYPRAPPIFCLQIHWNMDMDAKNNTAIRDMEKEVNVHWRELISGPGWGWGLLSAQMMRLMMCFDIFLEALGCAATAPAEFNMDTHRLFFRPVKGRNRSLPYKYIPSAGNGRFVQR